MCLSNVEAVKTRLRAELERSLGARLVADCLKNEVKSALRPAAAAQYVLSDVRLSTRLLLISHHVL